jgi:hypothetical protein
LAGVSEFDVANRARLSMFARDGNEYAMALDRNIYWVGRQWAVTGLGVQAVDQRLKGAFDIEPSRLWEDGIAERMRAHAWLNAEDFNKAMSVARERFPAPPKRKLPLVESVLELIQPAPAAEEAKSEQPKSEQPKSGQPKSGQSKSEQSKSEPKPLAPAPIAAVLPRQTVPTEAAAPTPVRAAPVLALHIDHASAKFLPQWKIRAQGGSAQPQR